MGEALASGAVGRGVLLDRLARRSWVLFERAEP
jgi:hypothetical protein